MNDYAQTLATPETATDAQITKAILHLHTALPAKVVNFDATKQTVSVHPQIMSVVGAEGEVALPVLVDVPVSFPRGGGFAVTFPLQQGDEGLVVFAERCIDGWWQSGKAAAPLDYRTHDLSDAMFIPGVCSLPKVIDGFFTEGLSMQTLDGGTFIRITNGTILIQGDIQHNGNTDQQGSQTVSESVTAKNLTGTQDVNGGGISVKDHTHQGDSGGLTGKPKK